MSGVNKVLLIGRLGKDPEVRATQGGSAICNFSLATSESWSKDGNKEEKTEWHRIVFFGKQAEIAGKYLKKGKQVYIEGRLQTRTWKDKETGKDCYATEIVGNTVQFLGDSGQKESEQQATHNYAYSDNDLSDIPF